MHALTQRCCTPARGERLGEHRDVDDDEEEVAEERPRQPVHLRAPIIRRLFSITAYSASRIIQHHGLFSTPACTRGARKQATPGTNPVWTTALCSSGEGHKTRRCRRVTYPESYITKYTTYSKTNPETVSLLICVHGSCMGDSANTPVGGRDTRNRTRWRSRHEGKRPLVDTNKMMTYAHR